MNPVLLLLLDSRAPTGAHNHSGGMEVAVSLGLVGGLPDVEEFCRGRLRTSGRIAASFAAAACGLQRGPGARGPGAESAAARVTLAQEWALLDAEFEAR